MQLVGLCANWNEDTRRSDMPQGYIDAVLQAGGVPVILPLCDNESAWKDMLDAVDAVIFTGGGDINPALFGEEKHAKTDAPVALRDKQEYWMHRYIRTTGKPYLCVCRGMQTLNCVWGGTLYQDIPDLYPTDIDHARFGDPDSVIHTALIEDGTLLSRVAGKGDIGVTSRHHQAVKKLGDCLRVSAKAPDGIVEAIEFTDGTRCLALQWHPESLYAKDERQLAIFKWLVEESKKA